MTTEYFSRNVLVAIGIAAKYLTSIAIIPLNKYIYVKYKFPNMTLTCIHFLMTFLGILACNKFGLFTIKKIPIKEMLPMSISFCGFVVMSNLSLQFNTIGIYQCLKILTMPFVMIISALFYNTKYSVPVKLSTVPVLIGIYMNSHYDVKFDQLGVFMGVSGALITSCYQVWIGEKQKQLAISSLQLLFYQAPLSALILAFVAPLFEPLTGDNGLFNTSRTLFEWSIVVLSGVVAFLFNLSVYLIIGNSSALTYNMVGHAKLIIIIGIGVVLFDETLISQQLVAVCFVLSGLVFYSIFRLNEIKRENQHKESLLSLDKSDESLNNSNESKLTA